MPKSKTYDRNRSDPMKFRSIPEAGFHRHFRTPFPASSRPFLALDPMFGYDCRIRDGSVNFLQTTGYGSYPMVSCPVTKTGIERFKMGNMNFALLTFVNCQKSTVKVSTGKSMLSFKIV
jgi:hypothetical protein